MSKKKTKSVAVPGVGIPCPRCGLPTEIREHAAVRERQLRQPFYYSRWFNCTNPDCPTTLIMRDEYRVFNDPEMAEQARRLGSIAEQLQEPVPTLQLYRGRSAAVGLI